MGCVISTLYNTVQTQHSSNSVTFLAEVTNKVVNPKYRKKETETERDRKRVGTRQNASLFSELFTYCEPSFTNGLSSVS